MKHFLILIAFLFGYQCYSQITLNEEDYPFPLSVDIPKYFVSLPVFDVPVGGEDQTWELPNVAWANYFERSYFAGESDQFPADSRYLVTNAAFSLFNIYSHYYEQKKADGVYRIGSILQPVAYGLGVYTGSPNDSLVFKKSFNFFEDLKNQVFPMTFGEKWETTVVYKTNFDLSIAAFGLPKTPSHHKQYVTQKKEVDGWGTIRIPVGENEYKSFDVLQVKASTVAIDSFFIADQPAPSSILTAFSLYQGSTFIETLYEYYAKGFTEPVAKVLYDIETNSVYELQYLDVSMLVSVEDKSKQNSSFVFPSPVTGNEITIVSQLTPEKFNLFDQLGNIVISKGLNSTSDSYTIEIPAQLANGIYYFEILDNNGNNLEKGKVTVLR